MSRSRRRNLLQSVLLFLASDAAGLSEKITAIRKKYDHEFYYSSQMVFPWAVHFVETAMDRDSLEEHKFFLVTGIDAAHVNGPVGGTYYLMVMMDANRNTVALAWAHFADNENDPTWLSFMEWVKLNVRALNSSSVTVIRDGKKSISKALTAHLTALVKL